MSMAQDNMPGMYLTLLRVMTVSGFEIDVGEFVEVESSQYVLSQASGLIATFKYSHELNDAGVVDSKVIVCCNSPFIYDNSTS